MLNLNIIQCCIIVIYSFWKSAELNFLHNAHINSASRKSCRCHISRLPKPWSLLLSIFHLFLICVCEYVALRTAVLIGQWKDTLFLWVWGAAPPLGAASGALAVNAFHTPLHCIPVAVFGFLFGVKWELTDLCCISDRYTALFSFLIHFPLSYLHSQPEDENAIQCNNMCALYCR